jgi:hypothetical protein
VKKNGDIEYAGFLLQRKIKNNNIAIQTGDLFSSIL